jgi:protoheme ferro-lyase
MDDRGKELFISNGGETYMRVPCINTSAEWVDAFAAYCNGYEAENQKLWT